MLEATALLGRAGVVLQQGAALHKSNAVTGSGTVLRRGRMRRDVGAAIRTSLPVVWQDRGWWHPATFLDGQCATQWANDATTSCIAQMAAMRGTAPCASPGPFTVTVTGKWF